ncbi:MAG TPA: DUF4349 domain-containing protein [Planctomycetota bacterium]|nr:DUF4349 domain-containing protein [Planctomycetota bacterium]
MSQDEHAACWDLIPGYQAGDLSPEELARVDAHVGECEECASQLEEIQAVELEPSPRARLRERLLGSLPRPRRNPRVVRGVLAAAATFFLGIVGYVLAEIDSPTRFSAADQAIEQVLSAASPAEALLAVPERPADAIRGRAVPVMVQTGIPLDDAAVFFPDAKESDHHESADNDDVHQIQRGSASFLSYIKGEAGGFRGRAAPGTYDTIGVGVGGGGSGRYGGRFGGRDARVGATTVTDSFQPAAAAQEFRETARNARQEPAAPPRAVRAPEAPRQDEAPRMPRKIIRSGEMEFEIDSFDASVATLTKIAIEEQGFIATVNSEKLQNGKVQGTVVVRVPPEHLDTLLLKLRALGDLKSQRIGSEDVTKHYLDLESRLRAARTMEERLIAIIRDGKGQIKDLLQAEKELGEWRTKIETMVGEINYYNNLIAHSTLTISLVEKEIRAPFGLLETERVEMGLEVEDVEKAYGDALAAIADATGRVARSELKQLSQGQFNAILQFEVAPGKAGPLRDRLKQLGVLARLDINRAQETQGGSGKPQDAKIHQNDTQFLVSLYNLANIEPRDTLHLSLASADAEKSYQAILLRIDKAAGRILSSGLSREKNDQTSGHVKFQVKTADADAVLEDLRAQGEVLKMSLAENASATSSTKTKRGFDVSVIALGMTQPKETSTIVLASQDVTAGYRLLAAAAKAAEARFLTATLNENDRKNRTANLSVEIRREHEAAIAEAAAKAGDVYTRTSTRAQDAENITDSKVLLHFRLFDASNIPARETVKLSVEVGDVDAVSKSLESEYKTRLVDTRHTRDAGGHRETTLSIDVPLREAAGAIERIKALGSVLDHVSSRDVSVPDNELALARLELRVTNEVLVGRDSGPVANMKRGLAISLQAASWALMLIMIGVCFVCPLLAVLWAGLKLRRKFAAKEVATTTAA